MSNALNLTTVTALQDYVRDFHDQLLTEMLVGFRSSNLFTPHEGIKREKILTEITVAALSRRYSSTFQATNNAFNFIPRKLRVVDAKVDLIIIPKDFESNYLGMFRKRGQDSYDLPFARFILDRYIAKIQEEQEYAIWRAEEKAVPASGDLLAELFDGLGAIIAEELTATNLTPTTTGALTASNTVASVENCVKALGDAYLNAGVDIFLNPVDAINYVQNYRASFGNFYGQNPSNNQNFSLDIGNHIVHSLTGVPKNCILVSPKENIHYGYDGPGDDSLINFETEDRKIKMWTDYKIGVQFGIISDSIMSVNEQWNV
jgi:hypothetical protein